eukprot:8258850-Pyramimonas_sp.AAC.1
MLPTSVRQCKTVRSVPVPTAARAHTAARMLVRTLVPGSVPDRVRGSALVVSAVYKKRGRACGGDTVTPTVTETRLPTASEPDCTTAAAGFVISTFYYAGLGASAGDIYGIHRGKAEV